MNSSAPESGDDDQQPEATPPTFDREAARVRYRKLMRGPFMRGVAIFTVLVILLAWGWGIAAAFAPNVEHLPDHDYSVRPARCIACHEAPERQPWPAGQMIPPKMPHWATPSCGFCHRQSFPEQTKR